MVREYINMDDVVAMLSLQADQRPRKEEAAKFVARSSVFRRFEDFHLKRPTSFR